MSVYEVAIDKTVQKGSNLDFFFTYPDLKVNVVGGILYIILYI